MVMTRSLAISGGVTTTCCLAASCSTRSNCTSVSRTLRPYPSMSTGSKSLRVMESPRTVAITSSSPPGARTGGGRLFVATLSALCPGWEWHPCNTINPRNIAGKYGFTRLKLPPEKSNR